MKKLFNYGGYLEFPFKLSLKLKLTVLLTIATLFQIQANTYSLNKKISLEFFNASVETVIYEIEAKSEFKFLLNRKEVDLNRKVSIKVEKQKIENILSKLFTNTDVEYEIFNKQIVLRKSKVIAPPSLKLGVHESRNEPIQFQISGVITDQDGTPLPGANILEKGTTNGAQADFDGIYSINAASDAILVFSYIGYKSLEIPVNGQSSIDVSLDTDVTTLEEIVIVGYGTQRKQDLTGAVSVVKTEDLAKQPSGQVTSQLQGRASGVTITGGGQPGEAPQIKIRGSNTFGNNNPLYVVDGIPTDNISDLNPNDVETMQVLKDAGSASIYGSRAANGVIVITTKRGKGKMKVTYDAYYGTQMVQNGNPWNILSSQEMAELNFMALRNTNPGDPINHSQYGNGANPVLPNYIAPVGANTVDEALYNVNPNYTNSSDLDNFYRIVEANKQGTNWFQEIFNPASITSHNLSVSNGSEKGSYLFSLNYFDQEGTLNNTYLKRYTMRSNSVFNISENIRIGQNLSFSIRDNPQIEALTEGSAIGMAIREQPIIPVRDINGNYAGSFGSDLGNARNPVAILDRLKNNRGVSNRIFGNIFAEVDFLQNFTLRSSFGGQYYSLSFNSFTFPEYENAENNSVNAYEEAAATNYNYTWTNTLQYQNTFNDLHNINLLIGTEAYQYRGREVGGRMQNYFSFDPNYVTLETGSGTQTNYSWESQNALSSLIGRLDYNFDDRYLLSATIRRDGSSRFLNNQYGWFPAVSAGWNISNESFMPALDWLNNLKVRGGYGVMGNQLNVDPANSFTTFGGNQETSYYGITAGNQSTAEGFQQTRIGNPDAKWEKNTNFNIGLDADLINNKVRLSLDYYKKDIKDLLFNPDQPATVGTATVPYVNVAQMSNSGLDMDITGNFNLTKDLRLNTTATLTTYNNEIKKIADGYSYFDREGRRFNGSTIIRNAVGHSVSEFYGYKIAGFWNSEDEIASANAAAVAATGDANATYQSDVAVGRFRYEDVNGDGRITADDRDFIGDPNPDFTYGLNIELLYKNWDLSMFLYGSQGNDIWNNVKWWTDFYSSFTGAKSSTALYNSWTPQNTNAIAPIQETTGSFSTADVPNSYFVEDGSYLRAKHIQLGYTFPSDLMNKFSISKLRLYAQMVNAFTITSYSGIDPEISGDTVNFGIDEGAYPNQRQLLFGLNVIF